MDRATCRVALMLDLQWPYKRHAEVYAGIQRFAEERGWVTIIDEFAHDTLRRKQGAADRYDGVIARANHSLARRAAARRPGRECVAQFGRPHRLRCRRRRNRPVLGCNSGYVWG